MPHRSMPAALVGWVVPCLWAGAALADEGQPTASVCKAPTAPAALRAQLDEAEAAYAALDADAFHASMDRAMDVHRCLGVAVPPVLAARMHWMHGIWMYIDDQKGVAAHSLAAARSLEGTWTLSPAVLPKGHEIRVLYAQQSPTPELAAQPPAKVGELLFDGVVTNQRPVDRATLFQHRHPEQGVLVTDYLRPDEGMPFYGADVSSPTLGRAGGGGGATAARSRSRVLNPWLAAGAGLAGAGAVATYVIARQAESSFKAEDASLDREQLDALRGRAHGASATSAGLTVTAGALGVSAFFVGVW